MSSKKTKVKTKRGFSLKQRGWRVPESPPKVTGAMHSVVERSMQFDAGRLGSFRAFAGPYLDRPWHSTGVLLERSYQSCKHAVFLDIPDFGVPGNADDVTRALIRAFMLGIGGAHIYVGCRGGIGRTGMFLALMTKAQDAYTGVSRDPVAKVRKEYLSHAVETEEQARYVQTFDVSRVVDWFRATEAGMRPVPPRGWQRVIRKFSGSDT